MPRLNRIPNWDDYISHLPEHKERSNMTELKLIDIENYKRKFNHQVMSEFAGVTLVALFKEISELQKALIERNLLPEPQDIFCSTVPIKVKDSEVNAEDV